MFSKIVVLHYNNWLEFEQRMTNALNHQKSVTIKKTPLWKKPNHNRAHSIFSSKYRVIWNRPLYSTENVSNSNNKNSCPCANNPVLTNTRVKDHASIFKAVQVKLKTNLIYILTDSKFLMAIGITVHKQIIVREAYPSSRYKPARLNWVKSLQ